MIYLDHNATTPIDERVVEAMQPFLHAFYGNPSGLYRLGRLARSAIETAREQVAALVGTQPSQIVFTSGGTEANNLAVNCVEEAAAVAISAIEHPSLSEPVLAKRTLFRSVGLIEVDADGRVRSETIERLSLKPGDFVSVMLANNETGVIQDIAGLSGCLRWREIVFHTDAVQAVGKIPVSFDRLGVDFMTVSSHKLYGPKGAGALVFAKGREPRPLLLGGGQEKGLRAGTENVAAIVGFGKAAELAGSELFERRQRMLALREKLERALVGRSDITIFSKDAERLPNTVQISIDGVDGEMALMLLDRRNIAVSSGSACASGAGEPSPVLTAMGIDPDIAKGAIRISFGQSNGEKDVEELLAVLHGLKSD